MLIKGIDEKEYRKKYYEEHKDRWKEYELNGKYIYFLAKDGVVNYVGSTSDIYRRIQVHKSLRGDTFDLIMFMDLSCYDATDEELRNAEYWWQNLCTELKDCTVHPINRDILNYGKLVSCMTIVPVDKFNKKLFK